MRWFLVPLLGLFALWVMSVERARADEGCPADRPHARYAIDTSATVICESMYRQRLVCPSELVPGDTPKLCHYVNDTVCSQPPVRSICLSDEELRAAQK